MLQKPYNISFRGITIDGNLDNTVTWQVSGDIQTVYKIDILLNTNNSLVWTSNKVTSYALKHTIPAKTLTNGLEFKIIVTIFNQSNQSISSDAEIFQTSSTPIVTVDAIGTVNSYSFNFTAQYSQSENVPLRNYNVLLYDIDKNLIDNSDIKTSLPMQYLFSNLQTEQSYYIEFQATSSKGLTGKSGLILFDVFYYRPKMNIRLEGKNIDNAGIELSWFVSQIILQNNGGTFINNEKIDVTNGSVIGDDGFTIDGNFSLKVWIESPANKVDLLLLNGDNGQIKLQYHVLDEKFHLYKVDSNKMSTNYETASVTGSSFVVLIQQIGNDMNINAVAIT